MRNVEIGVVWGGKGSPKVIDRVCGLPLRL